MHTFLHALLLFLTFVTAVIGFIEVAIGDDGEKVVQSRLIDWYFYVDEGGLRRIISSSAALVDGVLNRILGRKILSFRSIIIWCTPLSLFALAVALLDPSHLDPWRHPWSWPNTIKMFGGAFVVWGIVDFPFLCIGRALFRRIMMGTRQRLWVALYFVSSYGALILPAGIGTLVMTSRKELSISDWMLWPVSLIHLGGHATLILSGNVAIFALSTLLLFPVLLGALFVYGLRPVMEPLSKVIIDRLVKSRKGVFTAACAALTAVTGLLSSIGAGSG